MYSEVKGHWISQISIASFLSNTEEGSVSNKSSYTGQLCLASAVLRAFSATCFSWAQQSLQEQLRFRGAFSLEMSGFHGLNRKGVGNPVEVRHSSNTLCGSESYSSTHITWAAVGACVGNERWRPCCVVCEADDISVLCVHLHLCSGYSAQVLAGLAEGKSSSHSYRPSMTYCVVPGVLSCAIFTSRCEIRVLSLRAYIICFFRSCATVSSLIFFFCCLLNGLITKWVLSALEHQSAYFQDSGLLQHYT